MFQQLLIVFCTVCFGLANDCRKVPILENGNLIIDFDKFPTGSNLSSFTAKAIIQCNKGYQLLGPNIISCNNRTWSNPGKCLQTCSPKYPTKARHVRCKVDGLLLKDCLKPVEGTIAIFMCTYFYETFSALTIKCEKGKWIGNVPRCEPVCGNKLVKNPTTIIGGKKAFKGKYPWQVAVYGKINRKKNTFICGGALISERLIITAAHCISNFDGQPSPPSDFTVAVGKYYRGLKDERDINNTQFSAIEKIICSDIYRGAMQNYAGDISILVTKSIFQLTFHVQPVCMDLDLSHSEDKITKAYVAGWGYTKEYKNPSPVLKYLTVDVKSRLICENNTIDEYRKYITFDKICAGLRNKSSSVCEGDSGGGLFTQYEIKYYLVGIVSSIPRTRSSIGGCDSQQYGIFTNVSNYAKDFLKENIADYRIYDDEKCGEEPTGCNVRSITSSNDTVPYANPISLPLVIPQNNCGLPKEPQFGKLKLCGYFKSIEPQGPVPSGTMVEVMCSDGYAIVGYSTIHCQDGNWDVQLGECQKTCPPLYNTSTTLVTCTNKNLYIEKESLYSNRSLNCFNAVDGTIATYSCAKYFEDPNFTKNSIRKCRNGEWTPKQFDCVLVTGRKTERSPWHALIYKNSTFICFGTLINPKVVITAMNCFNREIIEKVDYLNKFVIAVGKEHKAKYDARDKKAQLAAIKKICWPDGQQKIKTVIVLSNSTFIVTDYVQPVAIDWSLRFKKEINKTRPIEGLIPAWNKNNTKINEIKIEFISTGVCAQKISTNLESHFLKNETYCALITNNSLGTCEENQGGGVVFKREGRHYLGGVLAVSLTSLLIDGICKPNLLFLHIPIYPFMDFIMEKEAEYKPTEVITDNRESCNTNLCKLQMRTDTCLLPQHPKSGHWFIVDEAMPHYPREQVSLGTTLEIVCDETYVLTSQSKIICAKNGWSENIGECLVTCPPLYNSTVTKINCIYNGKFISCAEPVDGSKAHFKCALTYKMPETSEEFATISCEKGKWSRKPFECLETCGEKFVNSPIMNNGSFSTRSEFPWHVGIYKKTKDQTRYKCGGTLIRDNVVLTSAKCVTSNTGKVQSKTHFRIVAGKFYRKYNDRRDDSTAQTATLAKIYVHKHFKGILRQNMADIALLVTDTHFNFTPNVLQVCIDWDSKYNLTAVDTGYLPGWGQNKILNETSEELRYREILITHDTSYCAASYDKMCGRLVTGSTLAHGDTGGGLVVEHNNKLYLVGISDVAQASLKKLFTKIPIYIRFVTEQVTKIKKV